MATEPTSVVDNPAPSNRRIWLVGGVAGLLAFAAGLGLALSEWGDQFKAKLGLGTGPPAVAELKETDLLAHTKEEWDGNGLATVIPIGRLNINLKDNESGTEPESFLMISLSLKVNLDQTHPEQFPHDEARLVEFNKRLENFSAQLNQELLMFFHVRSRQQLESSNISELRTTLWGILRAKFDSDFYTKRERKANKAEDKTKLIEGVLFEEFTIQ